MTYLSTVEIGEAGERGLSSVVEKTFGLRHRARVIVLKAGRAMVLVPEDPGIRRTVEQNEAALRKRGITVDNVLRLLRERREAR